ncbi:MAG: hypothetical protein JW904_08510 [Spirochaetales bacterium]|nr:hypothetical protein [Spirochaetales bacterium]
MKKSFQLLNILFFAFMISSCDFLSTGRDTATVVIPLADGAVSRAVGTFPANTIVTSFTVSVFGPGMEPVSKTVSSGARYMTLYVPAGADRHFTLEVNFAPQAGFPAQHLRSFKGRAIADLLPGHTVKLRMTMTAGATQLLVPDQSLNRIWISDSLPGFSAGTWNDMGNTSLAPSGFTIGPDGKVIVSSGAILYYADRISLSTNLFANLGTYTINSLAFDKTRNYLYTTFSIIGASAPIGYIYRFTDFPNTTTADPYTINFTDNITGISYFIRRIRGISVDPWTGFLYCAGEMADATTPTVPIQVVFSFDPAGTGTVPDFVTDPRFATLRDVIVKDEGIFVLNETSEAVPTQYDYPNIFQYDRNLNEKNTYGTISIDSVYPIIAGSVTPGKFYHPKRFFAHENEGLYIIDDSTTYEKVVYIGLSLSDSSWDTFPGDLGTSELFNFIE